MTHRRTLTTFWQTAIAVALILAAAAALFLVAGCKKESSLTSRTLEKVDCSFGKPHSHYAAVEAAGKRKGRGKPTKPPVDTTNKDPEYAGNVLHLVFEGAMVDSTAWNVYGPLFLSPSGMTPSEIDTVLQRMKAEYEPMGFKVTTDRRVFDAGLPGHRQQVIFTESYEWYGRVGGVAYVGSYAWTDPTPCFVFTSLLNYRGKVVADAGVHEAGHTLRLRHVPQPDGSSPYATYGNYMGAAYYVPRGFFERWVKDVTGNYVDQVETIAKNL